MNVCVMLKLVIWVVLCYMILIGEIISWFLYYLNYSYRGGFSNLEKGGFYLMKINMCKIYYLLINKDFLNVFCVYIIVFNKYLFYYYLFYIYFNSRVYCIIGCFVVLVLVRKICIIFSFKKFKFLVMIKCVYVW